MSHKSARLAIIGGLITPGSRRLGGCRYIQSFNSLRHFRAWIYCCHFEDHASTLCMKMIITDASGMQLGFPHENLIFPTNLCWNICWDSHYHYQLHSSLSRYVHFFFAWEPDSLGWGSHATWLAMHQSFKKKCLKGVFIRHTVLSMFCFF